MGHRQAQITFLANVKPPCIQAQPTGSRIPLDVNYITSTCQPQAQKPLKVEDAVLGLLQLHIPFNYCNNIE